MFHHNELTVVRVCRFDNKNNQGGVGFLGFFKTRLIEKHLSYTSGLYRQLEA